MENRAFVWSLMVTNRFRRLNLKPLPFEPPHDDQTLRHRLLACWTWTALWKTSRNRLTVALDCARIACGESFATRAAYQRDNAKGKQNNYYSCAMNTVILIRRHTRCTPCCPEFVWKTTFVIRLAFWRRLADFEPVWWLEIVHRS